MDNPFNKDEIREAFTSISEELKEFFTTLNEDQFSQSPHNKWSAAENLVHLYLSTEPVSKSLGFPKLTFNIFGRNKGRSRSYKELVSDYKEKLKEGAKANEKYTPKPKEYNKEEMLEKWHKCEEQLFKNLSKWTEVELDKYFMPHPILGKRTVRERLFFTICHIQHHHKVVKDRFILS
jgi:hypothetical protein